MCVCVNERLTAGSAGQVQKKQNRWKREKEMKIDCIAGADGAPSIQQPLVIHLHQPDGSDEFLVTVPR